jgi:hypothetical protein
VHRGRYRHTVTENGVTENGVTENGVTENGVTENGVTENGVMENGVTLEPAKAVVDFDLLTCGSGYHAGPGPGCQSRRSSTAAR